MTLGVEVGDTVALVGAMVADGTISGVGSMVGGISGAYVTGDDNTGEYVLGALVIGGNGSYTGYAGE